jgi:dihydrofolate reductase
VAALKQEDGKDLHVVGSSELMHALVEHDLVDEFRLMIDPVVVGGGSAFPR